MGESCEAKFGRARKHRVELDRQIASFKRKKPYRIKIDHNHEARESHYDLVQRHAIPSSWQPILGDCLHNYRCALDHIVWEVVSRHGTLSEQRAFPIGYSGRQFASAFNTQIGNNIRGVTAIRKAFDNLQPFKRTSQGKRDPARHPFWLLNRLDVADKHREILKAQASPTVDLGNPFPGPARFGHNEAGEMRLTFAFGTTGPVEIDPQVAVEVEISELDLGKTGRVRLGTATNIPLIPTLDAIDEAVRHALDEITVFCAK